MARPTAQAKWHQFPPPDTFEAAKETPSLAAPRDETDLISSEPDASHPVLSGLDAHPSGGGTWLGITVDGRWGALTNFTEAEAPPKPDDLPEWRSRGQLVKDWLQGQDGDLERYVEQVRRTRDHYPGFNVLLGRISPDASRAELAYVTNRNSSGPRPEDVVKPRPDGMPGGVEWLRKWTHRSSTATEQSTSPSSAGGCGLSNSVLSEPWKKVNSGRSAFDQTVTRRQGGLGEDEMIEDLFGVLGDCAKPHVQSSQDIRANVLVPAIRLPLPASTQPAGSGPVGSSTLAKIKLPSHLSAEMSAAAAPIISRAHTPVGDDDRRSSASSPQSSRWYATRTATVIAVRDSSPCSAVFVERDVHVLEAGVQQPRRLFGREEANERRFEFTLCSSQGAAVSQDR